MIKTQLIKTVPESRKYIAANVVCQLVGLAAGTAAVIAIADFLQKLYEKNMANGSILRLIIIVAVSLAIRAVCIYAFEKGSITESGTHSELVERGGIYAKLWVKQSALEAIGGNCETK